MPSFSLVAAAALLAYLIGGLPFGYWFVRLSSGRDIRTMGSGNIGATNVHRTAGGKAGLIVLLLDI
ncbi:MAG: glycerol-3-phosphate acyltransferase, partial [Acidobacteriaceae bacterium]|nr:glycerol-3-phosphate acyltransferase [Acidobacteriaceae bacterium]